jgi:hypothetical protein
VGQGDDRPRIRPATHRADEHVGLGARDVHRHHLDWVVARDGLLEHDLAVGPDGDAGVPQDREIVSFDGRVLVTRYVDPDAANRYGNMVYVRCAAAGGR